MEGESETELFKGQRCDSLVVGFINLEYHKGGMEPHSLILTTGIISDKRLQAVVDWARGHESRCATPTSARPLACA